MAKIILSGRIQVPQADLTAVRQALPSHLRATRGEPGCLTFEVTESPPNSGTFCVYEEFVDRDAFDQHQARVKASHWGEVSRSGVRTYEVREEPA